MIQMVWPFKSKKVEPAAKSQVLYGSFKPKDDITLQELAVVVSRFLPFASFWVDYERLDHVEPEIRRHFVIHN